MEGEAMEFLYRKQSAMIILTLFGCTLLTLFPIAPSAEAFYVGSLDCGRWRSCQDGLCGGNTLLYGNQATQNCLRDYYDTTIGCLTNVALPYFKNCIQSKLCNLEHAVTTCENCPAPPYGA